MVPTEQTTEPVALPTRGERPKTDGSRFAVALGCWCLSSVGVATSLFFSLAALGQLVDSFRLFSMPSGTTLLALSVPIAWGILAHMTIAWVRHRFVHRAWPLLGVCIGLPWAIVAHHLLFLYFANALLAIYLCAHHLRRSHRRAA